MSETRGQVAVRLRKQVRSQQRKHDAVMTDAAKTIEELRFILREWEPRVECAQCGKRYKAAACGPTHAYIWAMVSPS